MPTGKNSQTADVVKLASLKADHAREEKGAWIDFPDWPGVRFNVSSLHKPAFMTARDLFYQRMAKIYKKSAVPERVLTAGMGKLYHEHILHDWDGLDTPYSREVAGEILSDPEYRSVISAVEFCAARVSETDVEFVKASAGN